MNFKGILNATKPRRILLVRGNKSFKTSNAEKLLTPILQGREVKCIRYSGLFLKMSTIKNALEELSKSPPDIIISIGGGSVLDLGKMLSVINPEDFTSLEKVLTQKQTIKADHYQ